MQPVCWERLKPHSNLGTFRCFPSLSHPGLWCEIPFSNLSVLWDLSTFPSGSAHSGAIPELTLVLCGSWPLSHSFKLASPKSPLSWFCHIPDGHSGHLSIPPGSPYSWKDLLSQFCFPRDFSSSQSPAKALERIHSSLPLRIWGSTDGEGILIPVVPRWGQIH